MVESGLGFDFRIVGFQLQDAEQSAHLGERGPASADRALAGQHRHPPGHHIVLDVDIVRYQDALVSRFGNPALPHRTQQIAMLAANGSWAPTPPIAIFANALSLVIPQQVRFRFTADGAKWQVDDVYVDPYGKG